MRLNVFIARTTGISRRAADILVATGRIKINDLPTQLGQMVSGDDHVTLDGKSIVLSSEPPRTILLHKPAGYVVSRNGQGSKTIFDLLPPEYHVLKPIGRLDKESSGILLLTNDGQLAQELTHPSRQKLKIYEVILEKPLIPLHRQMISDYGVLLDDGPSKLQLERLHDADDHQWRVIMHEGRNRQIRRTFASLGYRVTKLHRTTFGPYTLSGLAPGNFSGIDNTRTDTATA